MAHYELKPQREEISASAAIICVRCDTKYAYTYVLKDVPKSATPLRLVYGICIHDIHEQVWQPPGFKTEQAAVNRTLMLLSNVFEGRHGVRGESDPPQSIQWYSPYEVKNKNADEKAALVAERKKLYLGSGIIAAKALYRDWQARRAQLHRVEVEFDFKSRNVILTSDSGATHRVTGRIDRIEWTSEDEYYIYDVKTGKVVQYADREHLVRDIQMTMYHEACRQIFGTAPRDMFLQGMPFKQQLAEYGDDVLVRLRAPIGPRNETHVTELANLIDDIKFVVKQLTADVPIPQDIRNHWEARSQWGKLAHLNDNLKRGWFVPRIGPWCNLCDFLELCRVDHERDWSAEQERLRAKGNIPVQSPRVDAKPADRQLSLDFVRKFRPRRNVYSRDKAEKKTLLDSGDFMRSVNLFARINEFVKLIPNTPDGSACPCRRHELVPLFVLQFVKSISEIRKDVPKKKLRMHLRQLIPRMLLSCPYPDCPHRKPPESPSPNEPSDTTP